MRLIARIGISVLFFGSIVDAGTVRWLGQAESVAQVVSGAIASVDATPADNTFTVTIGGAAVSVAGVTDANATAAALVTALNTSTNPYFAAVTWANPSAATITGTADSAGIPFVATLTKTGAGAGTVTAFSTTTANASPHDWTTTGNWDTGALPVNSDTVIIENSSVSIFWGLNQSAVTLAELRIPQSYTGRIGLSEVQFVTAVSSGTPTVVSKSEYRDAYLRIGSTLTKIGQNVGTADPGGSPRIKLNFGTVQGGVYVYNSCTASMDGVLQPIRLLGTHSGNTLVVQSGTVGVATTTGSEISTFAGVSVNGGAITLGPGVTHTANVVKGGVLKINSIGSSAYVDVANGTVYIDVRTGTLAQADVRPGGVLYTTGEFTITALNIFSGTVVAKAGDITAAVVKNGGTLDMSKTAVPFTVSGATISDGGGTIITSPTVTLTSISVPVTGGSSNKVVAAVTAN